MQPQSLSWVANKLNALVIGVGGGDVSSVCTDTRLITPGALFFALQGENADGHQFVAQALESGAAAAVVSQPVEGVSGTQLVVPDTLYALGDLAMHYRRLFDIPVVGITGSVGKTSTKEMTTVVLQTKYKTLASEKNYNNEIGLPLAVFNLDETYRAAVFEMGMRGLHQIERLAEIAQPTVGVITNIGYAHIELLGSQQNIARAKSELFARLPKNGVAIADKIAFNWSVVQKSVPPGCRIMRWSRVPDPKADVALLDDGKTYSDSPTITTISERDGGTDGTLLSVQVGGAVYPLRLHTVGAHNHLNALAALAVAHALAVPIPQATAALEAWRGADDRMTVRHSGSGLTVLDDCYNAGPESMAAALTTLSEVAAGNRNAFIAPPKNSGMDNPSAHELTTKQNRTQSRTGSKKGRTVAVLGDMKELGRFSRGLHDAVGCTVALTGVSLLVTVGELAKEIAAGAGRHALRFKLTAPEMRHFDDSQQAAAQIKSLVQQGDTILVKGSRAMRMEQVVAALVTETAEAAKQEAEMYEDGANE